MDQDLEKLARRVTQLERTLAVVLQTLKRQTIALTQLTRSIPDPVHAASYRRIVMECSSLKGLEFCRALRQRGLRTPLVWQRQGCPPQFDTAYTSDRYWAHRINDMKSRYRLYEERDQKIVPRPQITQASPSSSPSASLDAPPSTQ